jgi:outer membrane protein
MRLALFLHGHGCNHHAATIVRLPPDTVGKDLETTMHMHIRNRRIARGVLTFVFGLAAAAPATAQQAPATLSLEEAVQLARRHNPTYRAQANDEAVADWALRSAYGDLLPSASMSGNLNWRAGGTRRIENIDLGLRQPDQMSSGYGLGVGMTVSGQSFFGIKAARADRDATDARIEAAGFALEASITRQYVTAARTRDAVELAKQELASTEEAYKLAQARFEGGAATRIDVAQAEVDRGRAEIGLLQSEAFARAELLRLLQQIGLDLVDRPIELTTRFDVFEPKWSLDELIASAMQAHPQLIAARANESAGVARARSARMSYLPTISISGGWSGYTQTVLDENYLITQAEEGMVSARSSCEATNDLYARLANPLPARDCNRFVFTDADRQAILAENSLFPFDFTKSPPSFNMSISLPIFNGFAREANVQQASASAEDAKQARRNEELARRTIVATTYLAVLTAYRTVGLEVRNVAAAGEQLELARERYRLGAGDIIELAQAQANKTRADQAHLNAVYAFHENLAALEAEVGKKLR